MGDNDNSQSLLNDVKKCEQIKCETMFNKLHKCGFSPQRCIKALVSTGFSSERVAGEWLVSHIEDEDLDSNNSRDFYISLCPKGSLAEAVKNYWEVCKSEYGWGPAQEYPPHMTIIPRFQIDCNKVMLLHHVLRNRLINQPLNHHSLSLPLEFLSTCDPLDFKKSFLGYQATIQARNILELFSNALLKDLDAIGIVMDDAIRRSRKGIFHLSLSYGFCPSHLTTLSNHINELVLPKIKEEPLSCWELCLFSCDNRCVEEMFEMRISLYEWQLSDGLSLDFREGDLVGLLANDTNGVYGLVTGINMYTGKIGTFSTEIGDRVPISRSWVLHQRLPLESPMSLKSPLDILEIKENSKSLSSTNKSEKGARRVFVMRHGERVDFCFRNWIAKCFDSKGVYKRHNLNMPPVLPKRKPEQFFHDCPLTVIGTRVAYETGVALRRAGVSFKQCYSSPALRCVETAAHCLKGLNQEDIGIRIEPLLFEWLGWYKGQMPQFLSSEQLRDEGLPIQIPYTPVSRIGDLRLNETPSQYYERKGRLVKRLIDQNKHKGTTLLIIGHAASLDVCTRPLVNKSNWPPQITEQEFNKRSSVVPFCGIVVAEEKTLRWQFVDSPISSFTHCKNGEFNWREFSLPN